MKLKKLLSVLLAVTVGTAAFAQSCLKFETNGSVTTVENFSSKKRYLAKDNVRFINQTDNTIYFKIWGKKKSDSEREFLGMLQVSKNDTQLKSLSTKLKKFKYVELECGNGSPFFDVIDVEHNDMYFYIKDFKPNPKNGITAINDR